MPRFKLLAGKHSQKEQVGTNDKGEPVFAPVIYKQGDIFDSPLDLAKMFNAGPGAMKFEKVGESRPSPQPSSEPPRPPKEVPQPVDKPVEEFGDFDRMSVKQLQDYAKEKGVDLKGETNKVKIIALLHQVPRG